MPTYSTTPIAAFRMTADFLSPPSSPNDRYDTASILGRPNVFRLNIGVSKPTHRSLFGPPPHTPVTGGIIDTGHDFTVLDQILPPPIYSPLSWVCVLNPSEETFKQVQLLLAEAYDLDVAKYTKRQTRHES